MQIIKNNPYRIVGLLVGATAKEQERQVRRLKQFIEAEQEPQEDFSFPALGAIHRTFDSVTEASSKLNLDNDKMNAALFWFYKGNAVTDEPAFEALKNSDIDTAIEIWTKLTSSGKVTQRNSSAFQNLSTLLLCISVNAESFNEQLFELGLSLKLKFLESDFIKDFSKTATDETFKISKKELQLLFLDQVQSEIEKNDGSTSHKLIKIISQQSFLAKDDFLKLFVQNQIEQIEKQIKSSKAKRKANKANAANIGKELYDAIGNQVIQLKNILGINDLRFSSISDKVSDEILQCGIDYFLHYCDTNTDPSAVSMDLFNKAKIFAVGNIVKQRCQENTENLQEWIDKKPERDKQKKVENDLEFITSKLEHFQNFKNTISNAKDLLDSCKPKLDNIRSVLGASDNFYLEISSAVVINVQRMLVTVVNDEQEHFLSLNDKQKLLQLMNLKTVIREALDVSNSLGSLDMLPELRTSYNNNHSILKSLASQLSVESSSYSPASSTSSSTYRPIPSSSSSAFPWFFALIVTIISLASGAGLGGLLIGFIAFSIGKKIAERLDW